MISVIIPVYNREHLVLRAVRSVLAQGDVALEVVVVDDGSTDASASVVEALQDDRVRLVRQSNQGAAAARNHGVREASGEVVTFLDSDDEALPGWLSTFEKAFAEGADIVCCGLEKVGRGPEAEGGRRVLLPGPMGPVFDDQVGRFTNGGVYALRRSHFLDVGGFTPTLRSGQHTEFSMRLLTRAREEAWSLVCRMEPLVRVHVHGGSRIRTNPAAVFAGSTYTLRRHRDLLAQDPELHSSYHAVAGVNAARLGRYAEARQHLRRSAYVHPGSAKAWVRAGLAHIPGILFYRWGPSRRTS